MTIAKVGQVLRCGDTWGLVLKVVEGLEDAYGVLEGRVHMAVLAPQPVEGVVCPSCWQEDCWCDGSEDPWRDVSRAFVGVEAAGREFWALDSPVTVAASRARVLEVVGVVEAGVVVEVCKRVAAAMRRRAPRKLSPRSGKWVERCRVNAFAVLSPNGPGLG